MAVERPEPEQHTSASGRMNISVKMSSAERLEAHAVKTGWARLADFLLRVPMCGILLFFWFAFYTLVFGPNVVVTIVNVLFNMTCVSVLLRYCSVSQPVLVEDALLII